MQETLAVADHLPLLLRHQQARVCVAGGALHEVQETHLPLDKMTVYRIVIGT